MVVVGAKRLKNTPEIAPNTSDEGNPTEETKVVKTTARGRKKAV